MAGGCPDADQVTVRHVALPALLRPAIALFQTPDGGRSRANSHFFEVSPKLANKFKSSGKSFLAPYYWKPPGSLGVGCPFFSATRELSTVGPECGPWGQQREDTDVFAEHPVHAGHRGELSLCGWVTSLGPVLEVWPPSTGRRVHCPHPASTCRLYSPAWVCAVPFWINFCCQDLILLESEKRFHNSGQNWETEPWPRAGSLWHMGDRGPASLCGLCLPLVGLCCQDLSMRALGGDR